MAPINYGIILSTFDKQKGYDGPTRPAKRRQLHRFFSFRLPRSIAQFMELRSNICHLASGRGGEDGGREGEDEPPRGFMTA